jgi:hypothetical protein
MNRIGNIASGGTLLVANNAGAAVVGASINVSGAGNTENLGALRVENGGAVSGTVTTTSWTTTTSAEPAGPTVSPTQAAVSAKCTSWYTSWYLVSSGDICQKIADQFKISLANL